MERNERINKFDRKTQREFRKEGNKGCQRCGEVKPLEEFPKLNNTSNSRRPRCMKCRRKTNKTFYNGDYKKYKDEGKSPCKVCCEIKPLEEMRKLGFRNGKRRYSTICKLCNNKIQQKEYYENHQKELDRNRIKNKIYRDKNKDCPDFLWSRKVYGHIRTASNQEEFKVIWDDVREVYDFYGITYHIDHKVPKSWFKVGSPKYIINDIRNLQVIDAKYNLRKKHFWSDPIPQSYLELIVPYIDEKRASELTLTQ